MWLSGCWKADGPVSSFLQKETSCQCQDGHSRPSVRGFILFIYFFSQKESLSGRLHPSINFSQIFTEHHMTSLTSHTFSRLDFLFS